MYIYIFKQWGVTRILDDFADPLPPSVRYVTGARRFVMTLTCKEANWDKYAPAVVLIARPVVNSLILPVMSSCTPNKEAYIASRVWLLILFTVPLGKCSESWYAVAFKAQSLDWKPWMEASRISTSTGETVPEKNTSQPLRLQVSPILFCRYHSIPVSKNYRPMFFLHQSEKPSTNLQRPDPTVAQRRVAWSRLLPSWPLHQAWINQYPKLFDTWGCLEHVFWKNPFATLSKKNRFAKLHKGFHLFPNTFAPILFFCVGTRIHRKTAGTGKKGAQKLASACWAMSKYQNSSWHFARQSGNRLSRQIGSIRFCIILLHRFHQIWKLLKPRWNRIFTKSPTSSCFYNNH